MNHRLPHTILVGLSLLAAACAPQPVAPTVTTTPPSVPAVFTPELAPVLHRGWTSYTNANYVSDMAFDQEGNLWTVGSGGAVRWDFMGGTYSKYTAEHGLAGNVVTSIAVGLDGALWFGTKGHGLSRFDGRDWRTFNYDTGLPENHVEAITVAPDGTPWVGFAMGHISHFDGREWDTYDAHDHLNSVTAIAVAPDDMLWLGTGNIVGWASQGVWRFDGRHWTTYTTADGLADENIQAIAVAPNGAVWIATAGGVSQYLP